MKKETKLEIAQKEAQAAIDEVNKKISILGEKTGALYDALTEIQNLFDVIRNMPSEQRLEYERLKQIRLNWKSAAEKIDSDYKNSVGKSAGAAAAGAGAGVAVAALGPTAAMGIATTFGVASTGTAISALSGAAATNAALAWLGGGALAAGGGGMLAGEAFLALAGPVGWVIAGVAVLSSGLFILKSKSEQKRLEDIFTLISKRDVKSYELALVELNERIVRIKEESRVLVEAISRTKSFGTDYNMMTEQQQYTLGSYVNLMNASAQLLVNPIKGLLPKYSNSDFYRFISKRPVGIDFEVAKSQKSLIITICNLLYLIKIDEKDKHLLYKSFKKNKQFLESAGITKKDFDQSVIDIACSALDFKVKNAIIKN